MLWIVSAQVNVLAAAAQNQLQWAPYDRIPGFGQSTWTPYLVADRNRTIHVFASDFVDDTTTLKGIVYRQWTLENGWTEPNDILLPPLKQEARIQGALLDEDGTMHIIFYSGDENEANIYYSKAPAPMASRAPAWSTPLVVGPAANVYDWAFLVGDRQGNLNIIYSGTLEGNGLYVTRSSDSGDTWSAPASMFLTYDQDLSPSDLNAYVDTQDNLHFVWAVNNEYGRTESIYYARLEADRETWETPIEVDPVGDIPGGLPAIIEYDRELFLIYHAYDTRDPAGVTRHMRRSSDGGNTWTDKVRLFPHVGSNGPPSLIIDGNNDLHMFFGGRVTQERQIIGGMWHSVWRNGQWTAPVPIAVDPESNKLDRGNSYPRAIVSQGNVILLTSMTDPALLGRSTGGTWYSHVVLDAPELPVVPVSPRVELMDVATTPTAFLPTSALTSTVGEAVATPVINLLPPKSLSTQTSSRNSPAKLLVLGLGPTFLVIMVMIVTKFSANRIRR